MYCGLILLDVIFLRVGMVASYLDTRVLPINDWIVGLAAISEHRRKVLRDSSQRLGYEISAGCVFWDCTGLGTNAIRLRKFFQITVGNLSDNYPGKFLFQTWKPNSKLCSTEMVDIVYIAYAPAIFTVRTRS